jgi:hypothetical protein
VPIFNSFGDKKFGFQASRHALPNPAVRPSLFHLLPLVTVEAKVIIGGVYLCPATHAQHNQTKTAIQRLYRDW